MIIPRKFDHYFLSSGFWLGAISLQGRNMLVVLKRRLEEELTVAVIYHLIPNVVIIRFPVGDRRRGFYLVIDVWCHIGAKTSKWANSQDLTPVL